MHQIRRAAMVYCVVILAGCTPTPPTAIAPVPRDIFLHAPPARIWDAMLVILTDNGLPIENIDHGSWFLRSGELRIVNADSLADCGRDPGGVGLALSGQVFVRITVLLRPSGDSTAVRLQTTWRRAGTTGAVLARDIDDECVSKGRAEPRYLAELRRRIGP